MTDSEVSILIVDDDEIDTRAVERALRQQRIVNPVFTASDGQEGLAMLRGEGGRSKVPRPCLILLDLNMPRMNGLQFLHELRGDSSLTDNIVFVLSTSRADEDKAAAYRQHIAGYLEKPDTGADFLRAVQMLKSFVLSVQFPPPGGERARGESPEHARHG
jgi:CheY-like chemotaxis protein